MRALSICVLALLLSACDSGELDTPRRGQFEAEVSGDLSRSLSGAARFGRLPAGPGEDRTLTISLLDQSDPFRSITVVDDDGVLGGEGTYRLGSESLGLLYSDGLASEGATYSADSGTLRLTRYDDDRITGSLTADLAPAFGGAGGRASVSSTFDAVFLPTPF